MSSPASQLDQAAISLLLTGLEARRPMLSGATVRRYSEEVVQLTAARLIKPLGHEPLSTAITDHADRPVALHWSAERQEYGYFSETDGWVPVPAAEIQTFAVDVMAVISTIAAEFDLPRRGKPIVMVDDYLWEIGPVRLGSRSIRTPVLFARRLHDRGVWDKVQRAMRERPAEQQRVVLTSTASGLLPIAPAQYRLVPIAPIVEGSGNLAVDPRTISARLYDSIPDNDSAKELVVLAEGKEVQFRGKSFFFKKGVKQRRIINLLYDRYLAGQRWSVTQEVLETLDLDSTQRIRDVFKKHEAWGELLTEKSGMCGFCLDEPAA